ncbi:hypothetical protein SprV_0200856700 [Sparganum proliferum]
MDVLAEALYTADRKAREAVEMRAEIERKVALKAKERREEQLQRIAKEAREARAGLRRPGFDPTDDDSGVIDREELRKERARDRAHDRNLSRTGAETKLRTQRDKNRDISEQIALGVPNPRANANSESLFDQRLFNQSSGLDSGFAGGTDDLYNVYDKPWRQESDIGSHIYRPRQKDTEIYGSDIESLKNQKKFVPGREFSGTDRGHRLDGPVQFEKGAVEEEDPFNLSKFLLEAKKSQKRPGDSSTDTSANRDTTHRKRDRRD